MSYVLDEVDKWILTHAAIKQLKLDPQGYGNSKALTSPWEVIQNLPDYLLDPNLSSQIIFQKMMNMELPDLLSRFQGNDEQAKFTITANGLLQFRLMIKSITKIVHDKKSYNKIIDQTQGENEVKKDLKSIHKKLKGKQDEEIIETVVDFLKKAGPESIIFILRLLSNI